MGGVFEALEIVQIVSIVLISLPWIYWIRMSFATMDESLSKDDSLNRASVAIILPMRNEENNVKRKLESIISEIVDEERVELIVVDSNSGDRTMEIAEQILETSELGNTIWRVTRVNLPGKNLALNRTIEELSTDIIVVSDADANVSPGWLKIVRSRLADEDIGVVSGIEEIGNFNGFSTYYRSKSNQLRIRESVIDSTPVLEGSILAWKTSALGNFKLDEKVNADDAQIGFISVRNGKRSIVDPRIKFVDFESDQRTLGEMIRRSQGLSIALIKNFDLAFRGPRKRARRAIFNALALYVLFPWSTLVFTINSIFAFSMAPEIGVTWEFFSVFSILLVLSTRPGRSLATGCMISNVAHIQAIIGKRYQNWDPAR